MKITIKKGQKVEEAIKPHVVEPLKRFQAKKFIGKICVDQSPIIIQKHLRDEWK